jgi:hypothetical protein
VSVIRKSRSPHKMFALLFSSCLHLGSGCHLVQESGCPANACNKTKVTNIVYMKALLPSISRQE